MVKRSFLLSALSFLVVLTMTANAAPTDSPLRDNVGIEEICGGGKENPRWESDIGNNEFRRAMKAALATAGLLERARGEGRYSLSATLRSIDHPTVGCLAVTTNVTYTLADRKTGRVIYRESVSGEYTMEIWDSLLRSKSLRVADEGAARANTDHLVERLSRLDLSREDPFAAQ